MNYYNEIKEKLIDNEVYSRVKNDSKERHRVITYYEIGRLLNKAEGKYGDNIIGEYSKKLMIEVGKKYNKRTLFRMRQFYNVFNDEKVSTAWTQLTWSHLRLLFTLNINTINYYIQQMINKKLSVRELEKKIKSKEYERLPEETKNKLQLEMEAELGTQVDSCTSDLEMAQCKINEISCSTTSEGYVGCGAYYGGCGVYEYGPSSCYWK